MSLLGKLKSVLGRGESREEDRDVTVTVEHDPQNEAAVKGSDAGSAGSGGTGTGAAGTEEAGEETGDFEFGEAETDADAGLESAEIEEPGVDTDEGPGTAADEEPAPVEIEDAEAGSAAGDAADAGETAETGAEADETADAGSADADAEPADAGGESVDTLSGIGPAYAERLGDAGVETVADLADADAAAVSEETDIAEGRVQGWIDQAREH